MHCKARRRLHRASGCVFLCTEKLYCGWTNHLAARVAAHNAGKGAKYTKTRRPVVLAYYEEYATRSEAMRREAAIKKLTKKEKEAMAALGRTEPPVDDET